MILLLILQDQMLSCYIFPGLLGYFLKKNEIKSWKYILL
eukprot:UN22382